MAIRVGLDSFTVELGNAQHLGRRRQQQDAFGFSDVFDQRVLDRGGVLAVIADGIGGLVGGDLAGRIAVESFLKRYRDKPTDDPASNALMRGVQSAQDAVVALGKKLSAEGNVGSTMVAAALTANGLHWISVGDSALFFYRDGVLQQLNRPHTFARTLEQAVARGVMSAEDAAASPNRDALTSYLGRDVLEEIDSSPAPVDCQPGDRIVLCTDGLSKVLQNEEIAMELGRLPDPQEACDALVAATIAKRHPRQDNVTVMCIAISNRREESHKQ
jgi:protein phosphatase